MIINYVNDEKPKEICLCDWDEIISARARAMRDRVLIERIDLLPDEEQWLLRDIKAHMAMPDRPDHHYTIMGIPYTVSRYL